MKIIGKIGLLALFIGQVSAAMLYEGKQYIDCGNCVDERDSQAFAVQFVETNTQSLDLVVVNSQKAIDSGESAGNIWSYRVVFLPPVEEFPGIGDRRLPNNSLSRPVPRTEPLKSIRRLGGTVAIRVATDPNDASRFAAYLDEVKSHAYPLLTGHIDLQLDSAFWEYSHDLESTKAHEFIDASSSEINAALGQAEYNPFFFAKKRLTVRVTTGNGYIVTLQNKARFGTPEWVHIYTRFERTRRILEPSYKTEHVDQLDKKIAGYCEAFSSDLNSPAGVFCSPVTGVGRSKRYNPETIDPTPCNPFEHVCDIDDENGGIFDDGL